MNAKPERSFDQAAIKFVRENQHKRSLNRDICLLRQLMPWIGTLPPHLAEMALFAVNTGCRDAEICKLRWDWDVKVPPLETFVFIVPGSIVKNGDERLIVLIDIAKSIVNSRRGKHATPVFA